MTRTCLALAGLVLLFFAPAAGAQVTAVIAFDKNMAYVSDANVMRIGFANASADGVSGVSIDFKYSKGSFAIAATGEMTPPGCIAAVTPVAGTTLRISGGSALPFGTCTVAVNIITGPGASGIATANSLQGTYSGGTIRGRSAASFSILPPSVM